MREDSFSVMAWWRHQMETFPRYWPFVRRIHRSPVNSPHKGQWRGALRFSFICASINGSVNNHEAGDLRCHRAHYDVIVMGGSLQEMAWCHQALWIKVMLAPVVLHDCHWCSGTKRVTGHQHVSCVIFKNKSSTVQVMVWRLFHDIDDTGHWCIYASLGLNVKQTV